MFGFFLLYDSPYDNFFIGKTELFLGVPDIAEQLYWRHKQELIYFAWNQIETLRTLIVLKYCCRVFHKEQKQAHAGDGGHVLFLFFPSAGDLYN